MKNLNKKIGVVALAAMMLVGGIASSGIIVQANGPLSLENIPNSKAHKFVDEYCKRKGVKIIEHSKDGNKIDAFLKKHFKNDSQKIKRLEDVIIFEKNEEQAFKDYIDDKLDAVRRDDVPSRLYRVGFGIEQYLILVNNYKVLSQ